MKEANTGIRLINSPARLAPISSIPLFQQKEATSDGNRAKYTILVIRDALMAVVVWTDTYSSVLKMLMPVIDKNTEFSNG